MEILMPKDLDGIGAAAGWTGVAPSISCAPGRGSPRTGGGGPPHLGNCRMLPSGNTKGSHSIASTHTPTGLALVGVIFGRHGGAGDRILRCQEAALMDTAAYAINREQTPGLRNSRKDQQQTHRWRRRRTAAALATEERSSKAAAAQQQPRSSSQCAQPAAPQ